MKTRTLSSFARSSIIAAAALLLGAGSLQATPLNLLPGIPDIFSSFQNVSYDATSDLLTIDGFAMTLDDDGVGAAPAITGGSFSLTAMVDDAGVLSGGTVSIGGTVGSLGFASGTLLTGTLSGFGFVELGGDPLEFLFDVTGGDAASLYGPMGGIIVGFTGFNGSFATNFSNQPFEAVSDTFGVTVPEPSTLLLLSLGLFAIRRRQLT